MRWYLLVCVRCDNTWKASGYVELPVRKRTCHDCGTTAPIVAESLVPPVPSVAR